MIIQQKTRTERQKEGYHKWRNSGYVGGLKWPTGVGKSYAALNIFVDEYVTQHPSSVILVVTATRALYEEWIKNYRELETKNWININIVNIDTYVNTGVHLVCDLLVLDEPSSMFGDERSKIWKRRTCTFKHNLWLDATPYDQQNRHKEFLAAFPIVDEISEEEAEANNWKSRYTVINYGIELDEETREEYNKLTVEISDYMSKFGGDLKRAGKMIKGWDQLLEDGTMKSWTPFECALAWAHVNGWNEYIMNIAQGHVVAPSKGDYERASTIDGMWNPNVIIGYAKNVFDLIRKRRHILFRSPTKVEATTEVFRRFSDVPIISFSESIDFINQLQAKVTAELGPIIVPYHSSLASTPLLKGKDGNLTWVGEGEEVLVTTKKSPNYGKLKLFGKKNLHEAALNDFRLGRARIMNASTSLDKGANVSDKIRVVVINSETSDPKQFIQRVGRGTRIDKEEPGAEVLVIVVYFVNTREYDYIRHSQKTKAPVKWIFDLSELDKTSDDLYDDEFFL